MIIQRLHHAQITIPEGAEAEARAFYCGLLHLPEIEKPDSLKGRGGFWMSVGGQQVHVGTEKGVERARTKAHLAYEVDNLRAWLARLEAEGIQMDDSVPIPGYERFEFRDPFGNRVEFIQAVLFLSEAHARYRDSYLDALRETQAQGASLDLDAGVIGADFPAYVARVRAYADPAHVPSDHVPESHLWLIRGDEYIGSVRIRHALNESLRRWGGHIGYHIRPSQREKGYGTQALRLGLEYARALGIMRALLTCEAANTGSRKIIEANGGVLENEFDFDLDGRAIRARRYWIEID